MKKLYILFFVLCGVVVGNAQNEGNIWYFGDHAGLDFNSGVPVPLLDGQLSTVEGCATLSTVTGELSFYTDGVTVWNKSHQVMENGTDLFGHESTSQSATIIQKPGSDTLFYIFTIDAEFRPRGFCYSVVDISLNGGLGSVISKNNYIFSPVSEKVAVTKHADNLDFWITVHGVGTSFYSYLLSSNGLSNTPVQSNCGYSLSNEGLSSMGIMKFSPDGKKLAVTTFKSNKVEVFDFDSATGIISNQKMIIDIIANSGIYYGIEFSPNSQLLYVSSFSYNAHIRQYNLNAANIASTEFIPFAWGYSELGAMQLGPDGKIYIANYDHTSLGIINEPDIRGEGCNYQADFFSLNGRKSNFGLPSIFVANTITLSYTSLSACSGNAVHFSSDTTLPIINTVAWDFGDGTTSSERNPTHSYQTSGSYTVMLTITTPNGVFKRVKTVTLNFVNATPAATAATPQVFCIQDHATLSDVIVTGQNIQWYTALLGGNVLSPSSLLQDGVTYYVSQTINNCESPRTPVKIQFQNTPAPTGGNQSFCSTQNPTLADVIVAGTNIKWYATATSTNTLALTTALTNGTIYYATQTVNGCESVGRLAVTVTLINTLNAADYTTVICDVLNDGSEIINIAGYNTDLIANTANCTFGYYHSALAAENQDASEQITDVSNYALSLGVKNIYVRITSSNGCHQIVALKLELVKKPVIPVSDIMPICTGSSITVDAGAGYDEYLWSTGETTAGIAIANPGNYSVTVSENHGAVVCSSVKNFSVVLSTAAAITQIISSDWTTHDNAITVNVSGSGDYEYSLDGVHYQAGNTFSGLESGEHMVYVRDRNGCGISKEEVYLLMYPKFFTPNGDGFNDTWNIMFSEKEANLTIKIFDRFGKLLKALDNHKGWNGTLNNQELPATDYWFTVTRKNGKEYRGHFALKR